MSAYVECSSSFYTKYEYLDLNHGVTAFTVDMDWGGKESKLEGKEE